MDIREISKSKTSCTKDDNEQEGRSMIRNVLLKMRPVLPTKALRLLRLLTFERLCMYINMYAHTMYKCVDTRLSEVTKSS
jgi:hypothetical protein